MNKLDPKLKIAVTTAYQLGIQDGEKVADKRMKLLSRPENIHAEVWEIITTLDKTEPLDRIVISVKLAERIKKKLSKHVPNRGADWEVIILRKLLKQRSDKMAEIIAVCEKELSQTNTN